MSLYRRFHDRFGTVGVVLGVIALILTLGGTALAASGKLTSKQKKEVEKIAKKYAGKPGAPGAPGAAGANGTNGKDGLNGLDGEEGPAGPEGPKGANGTNGTSVTATPEAEGTGNCEGRGGSKFAVGAGAPTYACNGKQGAQGVQGEKGEKGDPWTAGGTLPSGKTETGSWSWGTVRESEAPKSLGENVKRYASLSFPIPLAAGLEFSAVHYLEKGFPTGASAGEKENCPGTAANPKAKAGHLCVYVAKGTTASAAPPATHSVPVIIKAGEEVEGASPVGAILETSIYPVEIEGFGRVWPAEVPSAFAYGTWAVTAP